MWHYSNTGADPGFRFGARIEAQWAKVWGRVSPSPLGQRSGENFFNFGVSKCLFWCIAFSGPPESDSVVPSCYFLLMLCADLLTMDDYDNYN